MKQVEIIQAYKATSKLSEQKLPLTSAYKIFKLRQQMKRAWDFQEEEERRMLEEYKPEFMENGVLRFQTQEDREAFEARMREILEMDIDIEITPITLPLTDDISISPEDVDAMQCVITFQ